MSWSHDANDENLSKYTVLLSISLFMPRFNSFDSEITFLVDIEMSHLPSCSNDNIWEEACATFWIQIEF